MQLIIDIHRGILFVLLVLMTGACSEEVDLYAPDKTVPVVYALLNPDSTHQYIRIGQSFFYEADSDILDSPGLSRLTEDADLYVTCQNQEGQPEIFWFEPYGGILRDTGLFAVEELETWRASMPVVSGSRYKLYLNLKESGLMVYGELQSFDQPFRVIDPLPVSWRTINLFTNEDFYFRFYPVSAKAVYQSELIFRYAELAENQSNEKAVHFELPVTFGEEKEVTFVESRLSGELFLRELGRRLTVEEDLIRIPLAFDFRMSAGGEELYYMIRSANQQFGFSAQASGNLENALGIFSCFSQRYYQDLPLSIYTMDSLANSQYTKNLGFVSNH